jgi:hypothetical protein
MPLRLQQLDGRRRGGFIGYVLAFLIALGLIVLLGLHFERQNKREKKMVFNFQQSDPHTLMDRFILERSLKHPYSEGSWEVFLEMISSEDRQWLDQNTGLLARLSMDTGQSDSLSDREKRYHALRYMLRFGWSGERPILVQIAVDTKDTYGVAYVHPPGRLDQLREVFLINEGGRWKLRRFGGALDDPTVFGEIIEAKKNAGMELTAEERAMDENPAKHVADKRAELLSQSGLEPLRK